MKNAYLVLLLFIICVSCTKENFIENNETVITYEETSKSSLNNRLAISPAPNPLENKMEWAAFLAAQAIVSDQDALEHFIDVITTTPSNSQGDIVIKLENLLGSNVIDSRFRNAFQDRFEYYNNGLNGSSCGGRPSGGVHPPPIGDNSCSTVFCDYLRLLLDDNCLEIVLPDGFGQPNDAEIFWVNSTAHPMNLHLFNDVYTHRTSSCFTTSSVITNNNVDDYDNVILVRPYSSFLNNCDYESYSIDFTLFLQ